MNNLIATEKDLLSTIKTIRKNNQTIVTYNGSFDLLHIGHIRSIHEAKQQGDILIVLLNSDNSVKKYKGSSRPIIGENDRAEMLLSLKDVDYVYIFDAINPKSILELIKPTVHCNGSDWGKDCVEKDVVEKNGGSVHVLSWNEGSSTSNLIAKIISANKIPPKKAVFIDRDGTINDNKNGYVHTKEEFSLLPGVETALKALGASDFLIIIITNQSGISRGMYTEEEYVLFEKWFMSEMERRKIRIDKIYHCPHGSFDNCSCRKPGSGMLFQAVTDFDISLNDSWMIGDSEVDIILGREVNTKTIKLGTPMSKSTNLEPNYYANSLTDAIALILK